MNSQERLLISQLFDRLRSAANAPRDPEAEAFIRSQIGAQPHAPYAMAQTIIVQNQAIEAAQARIQELEAQLRGGAGYDRPRSALGGMGGRADDRPMGAPDLSGGQSSGPWAHQRQQPMQPQAAAGGGGFLAGAAQTALGVAGGVMLGSMLGGMFGSGSAKAAESTSAADNAKDDHTDTGADDQDAGDEGGDGWFSDLFSGGDGDGGGDW
jgi:hypothetical protein